jgi:hypothetical protein
MTIAIWLLSVPLLGLETGSRAALCVAVGLVALVASPLAFWFRRPAVVLVALGILIGFANFALDAPMVAAASLAACSVGLIAAGAAPVPVTMPATAAAVEVPAPSANRIERVAPPSRQRVAA